MNNQLSENLRLFMAILGGTIVLVLCDEAKQYHTALTAKKNQDTNNRAKLLEGQFARETPIPKVFRFASSDSLFEDGYHIGTYNDYQKLKKMVAEKRGYIFIQGKYTDILFSKDVPSASLEDFEKIFGVCLGSIQKIPKKEVSYSHISF